MRSVDELFENMNAQDLQEMLESGETNQVEFKSNINNILQMAREVSALANTNGGVLLIGVRENRPQVVTINYPRISEIAANLHRRIRPIPKFILHKIAYRGTDVAALVVKKYEGETVFSDEGAFIRDAAFSRPMKTKEIEERVPTEPGPDIFMNMAESIGKMQEQMSELHTDLIEAKSPKRKVVSFLTGFALGIFGSWLANQIPGLREMMQPFNESSAPVGCEPIE